MRAVPASDYAVQTGPARRSSHRTSIGRILRPARPGTSSHGLVSRISPCSFRPKRRMTRPCLQIVFMSYPFWGTRAKFWPPNGGWTGGFHRCWAPHQAALGLAVGVLE